MPYLYCDNSLLIHSRWSQLWIRPEPHRRERATDWKLKFRSGSLSVEIYKQVAICRLLLRLVTILILLAMFFHCVKVEKKRTSSEPVQTSETG